jgi:demethylmenaquinone methyltransferase/2-methoxy-6-polyprenyl-1,4-benzoquinol methylase/phosphoethanolamine N-methyltransferase
MQHFHGKQANHTHGGESHAHSSATHSRETTGSVIHWAFAYDAVVKLISFNRDGAFRDGTIRAANIPTGATVLDVGCGTGDLTLRAKKQVGATGKVYGIDPAAEMIQVAQRKAKRQNLAVEFRTGVIEALEFPDAMFDVALSSIMFHHLTPELKSQGLVELFRVLKPGGVLLIADFNLKGQVMFHSGLTTGVQDLSSIMTTIGYQQIQLGDLPFNGVGYLRAVKP